MFAHIHRWRGCFSDDSFEQFTLNILEVIMTTQADIDTRTDAVNAAAAKIVAAVDAIKAELAAGATTPADLNLAPLDAAVSSLNDATASVTALVPVPADGSEPTA